MKGFEASETLDLRWYADTSTSTIIKSAVTSSVGSASIAFSVPEAVKGAHKVEAVGASSEAASSAEFTVVPGLTLSPTMGRVGTTVTVTPRGYAAGEVVAIKWYDTATASTQVATTTTSTLGSGSASFTIPEAAKGAHPVEGVGSGGSVASAPFTVGPSLAISPTTATVGSSVGVTLRGYAAGETIALRWYDTTTATSDITTVIADARGSASPTFAVPESVRGMHRFEAVGSTGGSLSAYLTVKPSISLDPTSGPVGASVDVVLKGFGAGEAITVKWYAAATTTITVGSATASSLGSATTSFDAPESRGGTYKVEAAVGWITASTTFSITSVAAPQTCELSPVSGPVGTMTKATCAGFVPGETVRIYWDSAGTIQRASFVVSGNGRGSASFRIPDATGGSHDVVALASPSGEQAIARFTVDASLRACANRRDW